MPQFLVDITTTRQHRVSASCAEEAEAVALAAEGYDPKAEYEVEVEELTSRSTDDVLRPLQDNHIQSLDDRFTKYEGQT
jgi:hypothetical protein